MIRSTLAPTDSLARAVELTLAGFQQDYPVMDGPRLVGVLTHRDLLKSVASHSTDLPVQQAMRSEFDTVSQAEGLDIALTRMRDGELPMLMVVEKQKVIGLLTVGNIGELLALESAAHQSGPRGIQLKGGN